MGSQAAQGKLWGQRASDWATIQEATGQAGYLFVLDQPLFSSAMNLLDVGCGTGYFCRLISEKVKTVTGIDATPEFIEQAKNRVPHATFLIGEMEELPFEDRSFDIVCGFNSYQYAASTKNALMESKRVLVDGGKLVVMIWGNQEECESATYLKAVGSLLPPPPPGSPGPFALSENGLLESLLEEVGLRLLSSRDVSAVWAYPNRETALKGLESAGPVARAIEARGFETVHETLSQAIGPYRQTDGQVVYHNKYRIIISEK